MFSPVAVHSSISEKKACPCSDPSLCKPVDVPPLPELLAFTTDSALQWKRYNYTYITTLAVFGNLSLDLKVWWGGRGGDVFAASTNAKL